MVAGCVNGVKNHVTHRAEFSERSLAQTIRNNAPIPSVAVFSAHKTVDYDKSFDSMF